MSKRRKVAEFTGPLGTTKVYRDSEWGEWQAVLVGSPDATYHDTDKGAVMDTARVMAGLDVQHGA